jgi:hypothetical protein
MPSTCRTHSGPRPGTTTQREDRKDRYNGSGLSREKVAGRTHVTRGTGTGPAPAPVGTGTGAGTGAGTGPVTALRGSCVAWGSRANEGDVVYGAQLEALAAHARLRTVISCVTSLVSEKIGISQRSKASCRKCRNSTRLTYKHVARIESPERRRTLLTDGHDAR